MTPPDLAALAREAIDDVLTYLLGTGRVQRGHVANVIGWMRRPDVSAIILTKLALSRTAGRAEGLEEGAKLRKLLSTARDQIVAFAVSTLRTGAAYAAVAYLDNALASDPSPKGISSTYTLDRALASDPAPGEQVAEDLPIFLPGGYGDRLSTVAETYLADYVYSPDPDGPYADHDLTDFERAMVEDFLAGLFAEKGFSSILQEMAKAGMRPAPAHPTEPGEERLRKLLRTARDQIVAFAIQTGGAATAIAAVAYLDEALSTPQPKGETP